MKTENAAHFAEMFSSTQVYLREANDSSFKMWDTNETQNSIDVPYKFIPITITAGTQQVRKTSDNLSVLSFNFEAAVGQRNPRY